MVSEGTESSTEQTSIPMASGHVLAHAMENRVHTMFSSLTQITILVTKETEGMSCTESNMDEH